MASSQPVRQRQPTSRHEPTTDRTSSSQQEQDRDKKTTSDSPAVLLDSSATQADSTEKGPSTSASSPSSEPRKCWICFADETEDSPTTSAWRTPCPCALTAHETCLLDWVADLESDSRKKGGAIQCPQCKAPITIERPRNPLVRGVQAADRLTAKLVVPGIIVTVANTVWAGAIMHGAASLLLVFGPRDTHLLLGTSRTGQTSLSWFFGLPLIPFSLIASQTSLKSPALPATLMLFNKLSYPPQTLGKGLWPPSAAMTFAALPYMHVAYNHIFRYLFAERQERWMKAVRPRAGQATADREAEDDQPANGDIHGHQHDHEHDHHHHHDHEQEGEVVFQLDIGLDVDVGGRNEEPAAAPGPDVPAARPAAHDHDHHHHHHHHHNHNHEDNNNGNGNGIPNRLLFDTVAFADAMLGALAFPAVAAAMGHALRLALPKVWTAAPTGWARRPTGLLQSQWGRSVVGGCLFLVAKDAMVLYARWRLARDHGRRRVQDWKGERKVGKSAGAGTA